MKQKIALAGVPNCGKTTFWNLITGRRGKIGNWPGVTTEKLSAKLKAFPNTELIDLPGIYSLSSGGLEETAAKNFLQSGEIDSLIIIIDGTKPEQGLYLALELLSLGIPAVIGINYADELRAQNIHVDTEKLCNEIGAPVFLISAKNNENINALLSAAFMIKALPKSFTNLSSKEQHIKAHDLAEKHFSKGRAQKHFTAAVFTPFLLAVLILMFIFSGSMLKRNIEVIFEHAEALLSALMNYYHIPPLLKSLAAEGILSGFSSALSFVPELFVLFFGLAFLEDCGYMARFAFASDFLLRKIGLSGRSTIPLLLGFGCTVPAVYALKASDSEAARSRTLSVLMFVPCSARFPLLVLICETVFPKFGGFAVFILCFSVIVIGCILSFLQNRRKNSGFILELPQMRAPSLKSILKVAFRRLCSFITKAGGMVVLTSVLIWMLKNFSVFLEPVELQSESALFSIGNFLSPIFAPTGIPYEGALALFCGLFAKESALFALTSLSNNSAALFSPISAISFLLFYLIYSPCLACLSAIRHEFGIKKAIRLFFRQIALAYFFSFSFFQFALLIINIFIQ